MTAKDEKPEPQADPVGPADDDDADDDDTMGHSTLTYDYARQHALERDREAVAWANREAIRKQSKNPIDRLRGR
jgi:hypothetical protein